MDVVSDFPPNLIITIYYNLCKFTVASGHKSKSKLHKSKSKNKLTISTWKKSKYVNLFFDFDLCNFDFDLCNFDFDLYEFDIDFYEFGFELYEFDFDSALVRLRYAQFQLRFLCLTVRVFVRYGQAYIWQTHFIWFVKFPWFWRSPASILNFLLITLSSEVAPPLEIHKHFTRNISVGLR